MPVRCAGFGQLPALNVTPTTLAMPRRASADTSPVVIDPKSHFRPSLHSGLMERRRALPPKLNTPASFAPRSGPAPLAACAPGNGLRDLFEASAQALSYSGACLSPRRPRTPADLFFRRNVL